LKNNRYSILFKEKYNMWLIIYTKEVKLILRKSWPKMDENSDRVPSKENSNFISLRAPEES